MKSGSACLLASGDLLDWKHGQKEQKFVSVGSWDDVLADIQEEKFAVSPE